MIGAIYPRAAGLKGRGAHMATVPLNRDAVRKMIDEMGIDLSVGTIREMNMLVNRIEQDFGISFIRMEFGVPGLKSSDIAAKATAETLLEQGISNTYPPFQGTEELKQAGARFTKAFMDLDIPERCIIPTVGSMQGCFISVGLAGFHNEEKNTILFLDPGFPVNKLQTRFFGLNSVSLDLKHFRGDALLAEVDRICAEEKVSGCMWSSPNNPAWVVLSEE